MDPHSFIARAEAQRWIGIAEKLLIDNDLVGSKTFAIRARESDPRLEAADQILAIADTLLAAEKRVVGNNGAQQPDFYAILQLVRFVQDTDHIATQYRRLAIMLNPHQNRFPYSDQAFQLVNDAWVVLSDPMRKSMYDSELDFSPQQQMNTIGFNLEQQHHHHHQQHNQQQQHNFFSINHMEQELPEPPQMFQNRVQQSHQQLQQHNFMSQSNPVRPVPAREQEQVFQPQVQPFHITSTPQQQNRPQHQSPQPQPQPQPPPPIQAPNPPPPAAPPQSPLSWSQQPQVQAEPRRPEPQQQQHLQPQLKLQEQPEEEQQQQRVQQEEEQQQQQQQSVEQNADPVQLPSEVNTSNGVMEEEIEIETDTEEADEIVDDSPTFWTACPYCFYMYEYLRVYAECTLRCDTCKRAFQAVPLSSPPPIIEGKEAYFTCWGFFPIGVSMSHLEKNNGTGKKSNWTPFSPLYDASSNVQNHLNGRAAPKTNAFVNKSSGPRIYINDVVGDVFMGISEPSDDSDVEWGIARENKMNKKKSDAEWGSARENKMKNMKEHLAFKNRSQVLAVRARDAKNGISKNLKHGIPVQEGMGVPTVLVAESGKKAVGTNLKRQSVRVKKEVGKLDLNVEFNTNEGEEPAPGMTAGNRGHGQGEEDNIEGNGFFEGLDEFLSSLPILSVVNEEKVKAA